MRSGTSHAVRSRVLLLLMAGAAFLVPGGAEAQEVTAQLLGRYLELAGIAWTPDEKDPEVLRIVKTSDLKAAESVEVIVTHIAKEGVVTLRTFSKVQGSYLSLAATRDPAGLARGLLNLNSTVFGSYFVDDDGDVGFRFVFTTESGVGYDAFRVVVNEMLRIGDDVIVPYYLSFR